MMSNTVGVLIFLLGTASAVGPEAASAQTTTAEAAVSFSALASATACVLGVCASFKYGKGKSYKIGMMKVGTEKVACYVCTLAHEVGSKCPIKFPYGPTISRTGRTKRAALRSLTLSQRGKLTKKDKIVQGLYFHGPRGDAAHQTTPVKKTTKHPLDNGCATGGDHLDDYGNMLKRQKTGPPAVQCEATDSMLWAQWDEEQLGRAVLQLLLDEDEMSIINTVMSSARAPQEQEGGAGHRK